MKSLLRFVKDTMLGGLVFLVPVIGIVFVLGKALQLSKKVAKPLAAYLPVDTFAGIVLADMFAIAFIVSICFIAGFAARSSLASGFVRNAETKFLWKIPGYGFVKGLTDSIGGTDVDATMRPVLAKLDDAAQVAFEIERLEDGRVVVFVPGAPDPWSGAVQIFTPDRIEPLPISMMAAVQNLRMLGRGTRQMLAPVGS
jgi:uncharacterized membrane protein